MTDQPTPDVTRADVERIVRRDFPAKKFPAHSHCSLWGCCTTWDLIPSGIVSPHGGPQDAPSHSRFPGNHRSPCAVYG